MILGHRYLQWKRAIALCTSALYLANMQDVIHVGNLNEPRLCERSYFYLLSRRRLPGVDLLEERNLFLVRRCQARRSF